MTAEAIDGGGVIATCQGIPRNPFATRHTLPGRIPPLDPDGRPVDPRTLLDRLRVLGGTAAIQGPHGSGKTTLLAHLARELEGKGSLAAVVRLRSRWDFVIAFRVIVRARSGQTVCIDSWERMGTVPACLARLATTVMGCGLLVTSHRDTGLPLLARGVPTPGLLTAIVRRLPDHGDWFGSLISAADIEAAFSASRGNMREALYCLYDRFEASVRH
jgi:hypothetical protein